MSFTWTYFLDGWKEQHKQKKCTPQMVTNPIVVHKSMFIKDALRLQSSAQTFEQARAIVRVGILSMVTVGAEMVDLGDGA